MSSPATEYDWDYPTPFTLTLTPGVADIDGLNHTNNSVYVRWCDSVGWAHSEALGLNLADWQRLDRAMAIRRGEYDYLLPSVLGDELLLSTWITRSDGRLIMERRFQMIRPRDRATVMRGRWELVCIEISSGKPRRLPPAFNDIYLPAMVAVPPTDHAPD
ncbi:thioesterase family protein [Rhodopseudomonas sp. BAL398]|nr:thioesterase family protein [Rhodopseudomonas sp. BAL398]MDF3809193.1 thioesterase family protein [Rhodopseudomonas sp. BAL398]WOK19120.1 thioesterase family protein [Rhodopseudomonas sp. BAL398]